MDLAEVDEGLAGATGLERRRALERVNGFEPSTSTLASPSFALGAPWRTPSHRASKPRSCWIVGGCGSAGKRVPERP